MARRRKRQSADRLMGIGLALLGIALIVALGAVSWWVKTSKIALGADNCPVDGPRAVHAIMIDQSDPITQQQAQQIREHLVELKKSASFGTRFDIYTFAGNTSDELNPILRVCSPGRPEDANQLYENPERIKKNYEQRFSAEIDASIDKLLNTSILPASPIIESMRAASITSFGGEELEGVPLHLTLISDMIQHSGAYSQFRSDSNFESLAKTPEWVGLRPQLKGVQTEILYLLRPKAMRNGKPIQSRGHEGFWEQLIAGSGGELQSIKPI